MVFFELIEYSMEFLDIYTRVFFRLLLIVVFSSELIKIFKQLNNISQMKRIMNEMEEIENIIKEGRRK